MKVVKASVVNPADDGFICYLSRKEAVVISTLTGHCVSSVGSNVRNITDHMYGVLSSKGVPAKPHLLSTNISLVGDLE